MTLNSDSPWMKAAKAVRRFLDEYEALHGHRILVIDNGNREATKVAKQIQDFCSLHDCQQAAIAQYLDIDLEQPIPKVAKLAQYVNNFLVKFQHLKTNYPKGDNGVSYKMCSLSRSPRKAPCSGSRPTRSLSHFVPTKNAR